MEGDRLFLCAEARNLVLVVDLRDYHRAVAAGSNVSRAAPFFFLLLVCFCFERTGLPQVTGRAFARLPKPHTLAVGSVAGGGDGADGRALYVACSERGSAPTLRAHSPNAPASSSQSSNVRGPSLSSVLSLSLFGARERKRENGEARARAPIDDDDFPFPRDAPGRSVENAVEKFR